MSNSTRIGIIIFFLLAGIWFTYPNYVFYFATPQNVRQAIMDNISLDLDEASTKDIRAYENAQSIKDRVAKLGLDIRGGVDVLLEADFDTYQSRLLKQNTNLEGELSIEQKRDAVSRVIEKIRLRISGLGLSEVVIRKIGENRISIQIPGAKSIGRIKKIIETAGFLEFKLVDEKTQAEVNNLISAGSFDQIGEMDTPSGTGIYYEWTKDENGKYQQGRPYALFNEVQIDGSFIIDAYPSTGEFGEIAVAFQFNSEGGNIFAKLTSENINKQLAIVLDNQVRSVATIQSTIRDQGQLSGRYSAEEAKDISFVLKTGAIPVPVSMISKQIIGPTMGKELLNKGFTALLISLIIVVFIMILRYRVSGLIACIALIINGWLIFVTLSTLRFSISLSSLAGLILTMGMAIDANVIIFERIREEYRNGKALTDAILDGYDNAFWPIFDANFTTALAAVVLGIAGSDIIVGFSITLFCGIIISLFTSLFMTRTLFEILISKRLLKDYKWWLLRV